VNSAGSDIEVVFLGTGTSVGIPMIGCDCAVCRSPDPRDKRDRCSVFMRTPEMSWIIDTGPDLRHQCLRENIRHIDAVLITHAHTDHIMGFDDLRRFTVAEDASLAVHATPPTMEALQRAFQFAFEGNQRYMGYFKPEPRLVGGPFALGSTTVTPLPVVHSKVDTIGYLFTRSGRKRLAYISDVKEIPDGTMELLRGVDVFVVDCLRRRQMPTHFTVEESLRAIDAVAPRLAYCTHMGHELSHAELCAEFPPHIRPAHDGLRIIC
jgi:phosphoribosyl 1,2-cyclic phosphate phosphodiesterase